MNNKYFACAECKIFVDAGYRWAYATLLKPGIVTLRADVDVDRVLNAPAYWAPHYEPDSDWADPDPFHAPPKLNVDWLDKEVLPSVRQFLSEHRGHRIVFWDSEDLPDNYLLEWLQVGRLPFPTARFFAETLRLKDWDAVLHYDKTVDDGSLEMLLYDAEQVEAFRKAFYHWAWKADSGGTAGAA